MVILKSMPMMFPPTTTKKKKNNKKMMVDHDTSAYKMNHVMSEKALLRMFV